MSFEPKETDLNGTMEIWKKGIMRKEIENTDIILCHYFYVINFHGTLISEFKILNVKLSQFNTFFKH